MLNPKETTPGATPPAENPTGAKPGDEQRDYYDIFVAQGIKIASTMAPKLKGKASVDALGNTLFQIINKVEMSAEQQGIKFPPEVILHGAKEILEYLIIVSETQVTEQDVKGIAGVAAGKWVENAKQTGKMTDEELKALAMKAQQYSQSGGAQDEMGPVTPQAGPIMPQ